jgi:hypothetical protein
MKTIYKELLVFLLLFASLFLFVPMSGNDKCKWQQDFNAVFFNGVVVGKFIDSFQHSTPIVEVKNFETGKIDTLYFLGDQSDVFTFINKQDTISKAPRSRIIYAKKSGKVTAIGSVNFGCGN